MERGLPVSSHYKNILGFNLVFYIFQQRITAVQNLVKGTTMKNLFCTEDEMKIRHIQPHQSDTRIVKLEFCVQNFS
jgi:hypothetical protein